MDKLLEIKDRYLKIKVAYEQAAMEWEKARREEVREVIGGFASDENGQVVLNKQAQSKLYELFAEYNLEKKKLYQILKDCAVYHYYDDQGNIVITQPRQMSLEDLR